MNDILNVTESERHVVRLFRLEMPPAQARFLRDEPAAVADKLGVATIDGAQVDVFNISDLEGVGLIGYLTEGQGIPVEAIEPARAELDAMEGWVMVVHSRAFDGQAVTLTPGDGVVPVAAWDRPGADWTPGTTPLNTESARPVSPPRTPPREARKRSRRIGGWLFAAVMAVIVVIVLALVF